MNRGYLSEWKRFGSDKVNSIYKGHVSSATLGTSTAERQKSKQLMVCYVAESTQRSDYVEI